MVMLCESKIGTAEMFLQNGQVNTLGRGVGTIYFTVDGFLSGETRMCFVLT